jgi:hypothetical protein
MSFKQNIVRITTPAGIAVYPKIEKPDTKFNTDGVYSIDLDLSGDEAKDLIAKLTKVADEAYAAECKSKGKKQLKRSDMPWKATEDGKTRFKFKLKAKGGTGEKQWDQKPAIFDAKGNPVKDLNVGSGSTVKVAFDAVPYFTAMVGQGISLRLRAVQVIELRQYIAGDNFDAFGFKATDGFVKETEAVTTFDSDSDNDF